MFELCEKKIKKCLAAKGLGQTQARYDSLIENSPDGVVSLKSVTAREDGEVVNNPQRLPVVAKACLADQARRSY